MTRDYHGRRETRRGEPYDTRSFRAGLICAAVVLGLAYFGQIVLNQLIDMTTVKPPSTANASPIQKPEILQGVVIIYPSGEITPGRTLEEEMTNCPIRPSGHTPSNTLGSFRLLFSP